MTGPDAQVCYGVEGPTDAPFAEAFIRSVGRSPRVLTVQGGKSRLDEKIAQWNRASNSLPILVIRDWDSNDRSDCPSALIERLTSAAGVVAPRLVLRIAVRAIESWALADVDAVADFFGVSSASVPKSPDAHSDPKQALVNLCRRARSARISRGMVPSTSSKARVGPEYTALMTEFGRDAWDPSRASQRSPSLARAIVRIHERFEAGNW